MTIWPYTEEDAKREVKVFNSDNVFPTPKPERLMERIIQIATSPGDLVLDSFAGFWHNWCSCSQNRPQVNYD
ncbi:DNA methyltransferase [Bartonella sp. OT172YNZD]|uniref:DNA methyltransferase n=1 Tax=Bartonella sp. OT172YNZD TaxID=3243572 RepID=UPI0035D10F0B